MPLKNRLPAIRIPLRESDSPAKIDLQVLLDHAYSAGRFDDIDYSQELDPPLEVEEAAWVKSLIDKNL